MRIAHFKGSVLPIEANCNLRGAHSFDWVWQERNNTTLKFNIAIQNGRIDVECTVPSDYRDADMAELHRRAYDLCRAVVSLHALKQGMGLLVILDKFISPTGKETVLLPYDRRLPPLCTAIQSDAEFHQVLQFVIADPILIRHLSDLIIAIAIPHEAIINCSRVVEGIKALVSLGETDDRKAWQEMRGALNIEKDFLLLITETAKEPRHGRDKRIGGTLVNEIVLRAWSVMNKFMEYRKRGNTRLPLSEYPILKA